MPMSDADIPTIPGWLSADMAWRVGVTLAVMAVYAAGAWIPIPGLDAAGILVANPHGAMMPPDLSYTIFAIGIAPLLSALAVVEVTKIVFPSLAHWEATAPANARSLSQAALALALLFAAVTALSQADTVVHSKITVSDDPGLGFYAGFIVTLVAATALLAWLAELITRFGIGSGFWILLSVPAFWTVSYLSGQPTETTLPKGDMAMLMTFLAFAAGCTLLAAVAVTERSTVASGQLIWPPMLAYMTFDWIQSVVLPLILPADAVGLHAALAKGQPARLAVLAALTMAIFALRQRALPMRPGMPYTTAGALAVVLTTADVLISRTPYYPLGQDGRNAAVLVAIVVALMASVRRDRPLSS